MKKIEEETKATPEPPATSMISKIILTGFKSLKLIYYFTAGVDEVRCWTIREGT